MRSYISFIYLFIFIVDDVCATDQGGKDQESWKNRYDHCLQVFLFLFLYLGGERRPGEKPLPASQLSQHPGMGNSHLVPTQGPDILYFCPGDFDS